MLESSLPGSSPGLIEERRVIGQPKREEKTTPASVSRQSVWALNAANFFLAEVLGVVVPFLARFLTERGWAPGAIGLAVAVGGLGVLLMQTPAGVIVDRVQRRRGLLAGASLLVGACIGLLPLVPSVAWYVDGLLFVSGMAQAFFAPLLGALALGLVGHAALSRTLGSNQGWNHAGNLASALIAAVLVSYYGTISIFYAVSVVSVLAAGSVLLIRGSELDAGRGSGDGRTPKHSPGLRGLVHDRRVALLIACVALFHLANAPVMPLIGQYITTLGGGAKQVANVVLVAQAVMIPVALLSGYLAERWGRKPVFAVGFVVLPLRVFLYSLTRSPGTLVALQALDGIGAGIYGVVIVDICADLTRGRGGFNSLLGTLATAQGLGAVIGPLMAGYIVQYLSFNVAFYVFAGVAAVAAVLFVSFMPETRRLET